MAGLQELRKRLRSIRSTGQLAGAMRTAATAKYARLNRVRGDFSPYAQACEDMLRHLGGSGIRRETEEIRRRDAVVLMSSNRGLCGGFNAEFLRFAEPLLRGEAQSTLLLVGGRHTAGALRELGFTPEEFPLSDVPAYGEIHAIAERAKALYTSGKAESVLVLYQRFQNMMLQIPARQQLLPEEGAAAGAGEPPLLLPDADTIRAGLGESDMEGRIYSLALENAAGAQAATVMAMRSAGENAQNTARELELTINRRRQAGVTASVIETASGANQGEIP